MEAKKQKNEKTRKKCPPQDGPGGGHRRTNGPKEDILLKGGRLVCMYYPCLIFVSPQANSTS